MLTTSETRLFELVTDLSTLGQLATAIAERGMTNGLTMAQFGVLSHFVRLGGEWSPLRLARAFRVTKQTMTSTLARMAGAGLVSVRPDPRDGRAKLVALTEAGRAAHAETLRRLGPALALAADALPDRAVDELVPLLEEVRAVLDAARG